MVCCTKGPEVVEAMTKDEVVDAVAMPVAETPSVPVQAAPWGQQPTTLLTSAEQTAVLGQQRLAALLHWYRLFPQMFSRLRSSAVLSTGAVLLFDVVSWSSVASAGSKAARLSGAARASGARKKDTRTARMVSSCAN